MAESHVISALTSKHAELAGLIQHHEKEVIRLTDELNTITRAIRIFQPDYPINKIKLKQHRQHSQFFKKGEGYKLVLDILREATEPMSTTAIASEAIRRKGLELNTKERSQVRNSIFGTLSTQVKRGVIVSSGKVDSESMWAVKRLDEQ